MPVPPARSRVWGCLGLTLILLLLAGAGAGAGGWLWLMRWAETPQGAASAPVTLTIRSGTPAMAIAQQLADAGLIDQPTVYLVWLKLTGNLGRIQAGRYRLEPPLSPAALASALRRGVFERSLTIPEGWTAQQIAQRLTAEGWIADPQQWLTLAAQPVGAPLPEPQPDGAEGFCFPETYRFDEGTTATGVLHRMLETFSREWQAMEPARRREASQELSLHDVVTLAAMIEREARVDEEMPIIASVYLNRLRRGIKLQCCATVYYALGGAWDRPLTLKDLKIESPYNTYLYKGLPPGPIANPGRAALAAVLRPAETDYLFYVYRGDGRHTFSRTAREHEAAVREARRANPQSFVPRQDEQ